MSEVYDVCRGTAEKPENSHNYSGAYFRNAFKVFGGPIQLHSVGFFGPATSDRDECYEITVFVERPTFDIKFPWYYHFLPCLGDIFHPDLNAEVFGSYTGTVIASEGDIMYANFKKPINIPEGVWIGITFKLQGEPTARMRFEKMTDTIEVQTEYGNRKFQFLSGSCQMPVIRFLPC